MFSWLQFLTTPTADTPGTTLYLHFDNKRYIFGNEAEGTQRAINQLGAKMARVSDIFITGRSEWGNMGGLMGMILTLTDATNAGYAMLMESYESKKKAGRANAKVLTAPSKPKLNLYGPPNLNHMLATGRRFIFRKGIPLHVSEFKGEPSRDENGKIKPTWNDENICVYAISVAPVTEPVDPEAEVSLNAKKRTFDETFNCYEDHVAPPNESPEARELRYDEIRKGVVDHMFDSDWKFDTLIERHISEVEMPAAMYVRNPETNKLEPYTGPRPGGDDPLPDIKVLTRTPWPGSLVQYLPPTTPAPEAVSYIFRSHPVRGRFDPKRAVELGVEKGPKYAALARGESVVNLRGETITPDMVLGAQRPGQGAAIFEVPSVEYVEPLLRRDELNSEDVLQGIECFIWILGPGVAADPRLQDFISKMDTVKHIFSSRDHCPNSIAMDSAATQTTHLREIDSRRYSVPVHDNETLPQVGYGSADPVPASPTGVTQARRGLKVQFLPKPGLSDDEIRPLFEVQAAKANISEEVLQLAKKAQEDVENSREALEAWKSKIPRPETEVFCLGTGSALPSQYRNVSATLVRVPGIGNYLLDCGENTLGQLQRIFPYEEYLDVLRNLRMIWISHLHADHHLGTASVIKAWDRAANRSSSAGSNPRQLSVISDEGMLKWLFEFSQVEDFGYEHIVPLHISNISGKEPFNSALEYCPTPSSLPNGEQSEHYTNDWLVKKEAYPELFGFADIQACHVSHCRGAKAVVITFPWDTTDPSSQGLSPLRISYSGDCRPSMTFARIGRNSTVLIHEATFDDELLADAKAKKHSTTSEALDVGAKMNAKAVILTHFSQRYQKFPVLERVEDEAASALCEPSSAADDANAMEVDHDEAEVEDDGDADPGNADLQTQTTTINAPARFGDKAPKTEQVIRVKNKDMKVAVAFDYMRVRVGEIAQLEKFIPALSKHFEEESVDPGEEGDEVAAGASKNGEAAGKGNAKGSAKGNGGERKDGNGGKGAGRNANGKTPRESLGDGGGGEGSGCAEKSNVKKKQRRYN